MSVSAGGAARAGGGAARAAGGGGGGVSDLLRQELQNKQRVEASEQERLHPASWQVELRPCEECAVTGDGHKSCSVGAVLLGCAASMCQTRLVLLEQLFCHSGDVLDII